MGLSLGVLLGVPKESCDAGGRHRLFGCYRADWDLDRPGEGPVNVSQQAMIDLRDWMTDSNPEEFMTFCVGGNGRQ